MKRSEQKPLAEASWPPFRQHKIVYRGGGVPPFPAGTAGGLEATSHPPGDPPAPQGAKQEGVAGQPPPTAPSGSPPGSVPREATALPAALCHSPSDCHSHSHFWPLLSAVKRGSPQPGRAAIAIAAALSCPCHEPACGAGRGGQREGAGGLEWWGERR